MTTNNLLEEDPRLQELQEAVAKAETGADPIRHCQALMHLGQAYLDQKEAPAALTQFETGLKLAQQTENRQIQAQLFGYKGMALKMLGNTSMALQAFRKSNGIASHLKHDLLLCDSFFQIGLLKTIENQPGSSLDDLTQSLAIATRLRDHGRQLRAAEALAEICETLEELEQSRQYYRLAIEQARLLGDHTAECTLLTRQANNSLAAGDFETAIDQYEAALDIASAIENRIAEINILGGLFRVHALAGHQHLAVLYGEKIIQLSRDIEHFEAEITNIHALARYLLEQGQAQAARAYLSEGLVLAEKHDSPEWLSDLLVLDGQAHYACGEHALAIESLNQAASLATGIGDKSRIAHILAYLSGIEAEREQLSDSIGYAERAVAFALELENKKMAGEQQLLLALNYRDLGKADKAIEYCRAAQASFEDCKAPEMLVKVEGLLAEL